MFKLKKYYIIYIQVVLVSRKQELRLANYCRYPLLLIKQSCICLNFFYTSCRFGGIKENSGR